MIEFLNNRRFHRFLWFDPSSRDLKIWEPERMAQIAKDCQTARDILDAVPDGDVRGRPGRVGVTN